MEDFNHIELKDVCDLIPGFAFKSTDFGCSDNRVIKIGDIQPPYVKEDTLTTVDISNYSASKLEKFIVKYDDFVLAMTGATIGKIGRYIGLNPAYLNQRVLLFRPKEGINRKYVYYCLMSPTFKKYINNHIDSQTAQPNISANSVSGYEIPLPEIKIQNTIANILSSLDDKIELNNRINHNLEEQAQALYKSWFVDFEPFKDGKFIESELGMIPEGWFTIPFSSFIYESKEKNKDASQKEFSVTNNGIFPRVEKFKKSLSKSAGNNKLVRYGDLVFGMSRDILNWGVMDENEGGVSSAYTVYRVDQETISSIYIKLFINSHLQYFKDLIRPAAREGQSIDKNLLARKAIIIPPKKTLSEFWKLYSIIIHQKETVVNEITTLRKVLDTILPKMMSGELKINEIDC